MGLNASKPNGFAGSVVVVGVTGDALEPPKENPAKGLGASAGAAAAAAVVVTGLAIEAGFGEALVGDVVVVI